MIQYETLLSNSLKEQTPIKYGTYILGALLFLDADSPEQTEEEKAMQISYALKMQADRDGLSSFLGDFLKLKKNDKTPLDDQISQAIAALREQTKTLTLV